jgi:hypothetical protein
LPRVEARAWLPFDSLVQQRSRAWARLDSGEAVFESEHTPAADAFMCEGEHMEDKITAAALPGRPPDAPALMAIPVLYYVVMKARAAQRAASPE